MSPDDLVALVRARLGPDDAVLVRSNRALREASLQIFDRTFEVTSVLRLIALIVAAFGVTSALMALGLERLRELATLRALGATPAQVVELTIVETALLGGLAGLLAIPLGMVLAAVLVFVINQRSFGWTMPLSPSWRTLLSAPGSAPPPDCSRASIRHGAPRAWCRPRLCERNEESMRPGSAARQATADRRSRPRGGAGTYQVRPGGEQVRLGGVKAAALAGVSFLVALAIGAAGSGCSAAPSTSALPPASGGLTVATLLSGTDSEGFARATAARTFTFPADHGPHPAFRTEWWYFTGFCKPKGVGRRASLWLPVHGLPPGSDRTAPRPGFRLGHARRLHGASGCLRPRR